MLFYFFVLICYKHLTRAGALGWGPSRSWGWPKSTNLSSAVDEFTIALAQTALAQLTFCDKSNSSQVPNLATYLRGLQLTGIRFLEICDETADVESHPWVLRCLNHNTQMSLRSEWNACTCITSGKPSTWNSQLALFEMQECCLIKSFSILV